MIENEHFNCVKMVSSKVMTIGNDDDRKQEMVSHSYLIFRNKWDI